MQPNDTREAMIEYRQYGRYVKVSAIDPVTYEEVSIIGDAHADPRYLAQQAIRKLRYQQEKR